MSLIDNFSEQKAMIPEGAMVFYNSYIVPPIRCYVPLFYKPISKRC